MDCEVIKFLNQGQLQPSTKIKTQGDSFNKTTWGTERGVNMLAGKGGMNEPTQLGRPAAKGQRLPGVVQDIIWGGKIGRGWGPFSVGRAESTHGGRERPFKSEELISEWVLLQSSSEREIWIFNQIPCRQ